MPKTGTGPQRRNKPWLETTFWAALFVGAVLVATTGFFGGAMIYGIDHYAWPEAMKAATGEPAKKDGAEPKAADEKPAADVVVKMTDDWTYEPEKVTIQTGQTIRWDCDSTYMHTVTADITIAPTMIRKMRISVKCSSRVLRLVHPGTLLAVLGTSYVRRARTIAACLRIAGKNKVAFRSAKVAHLAERTTSKHRGYSSHHP